MQIGRNGFEIDRFLWLRGVFLVPRNLIYFSAWLGNDLSGNGEIHRLEYLEVHSKLWAQLRNIATCSSHRIEVLWISQKLHGSSTQAQVPTSGWFWPVDGSPLMRQQMLAECTKSTESAYSRVGMDIVEHDGLVNPKPNV